MGGLGYTQRRVVPLNEGNPMKQVQQAEPCLLCLKMSVVLILLQTAKKGSGCCCGLLQLHASPVRLGSHEPRKGSLAV